MLKLAPHLKVRFEEPLCCDLPLEGRRVELRDPRYVSLISALGSAAERDDIARLAQELFRVSHEHAAELVDDLEREGILVDASAPQPLAGPIAHWDDRGWIDALTLHGLSRNIAFDDDDPLDLDARHDELFGDLVRRVPPPPFWKTYEGPRIALPEPALLPDDRSYEEVLLSRRSNQPWRGHRLPLGELGTLLGLANRETRRLRMLAEAEWQTSPRRLLQSAFSALETYVFASSVEGVPRGIHHYDPKGHALVQIDEGLSPARVAAMCAGQERPAGAPCVLGITAVFERYMYRYRHPRAYRTLLINVSELAQKYILLATALGASTFMTPLFFDEIADELLGVDGYEEGLLEVVAIG